MLLRVLALLLAATPAVAQNVWTINDAGDATLHNGPPAGACSYPLGPLLSFYSYVVPGPCATPGATGAVPFGDIGINRVAEELWISDGMTAAGYQLFGTPVTTGVDAFAILGAPITGIDWDPSNDGLWVTDGFNAARVSLNFSPPCYTTQTETSFALPLPTGSPATALSHDPVTNTLWIVDGAGFLTQVTKSGALGPMGSTQVSVTAGGCVSASLTAVAADNAGPAGRVYVSDGSKIAVVDASAGGVLAPATFYTPSSCYTPPSTPIQGMALAASGNLFGSTSGGFFPAIGHTGTSIVPSPGFSIDVAGAHENELAVLVMSATFSCPPLTVLGVPFHLGLTPPLILDTAVIPATGIASAPLPIGVGTPIGETLFFQWGLIHPSTLAVTSTRGMSMTTALP